MTDTIGSSPEQPPKPRTAAHTPPADAFTRPAPTRPTAVPAGRYGEPRRGMPRARKIGLGAVGLLILGGVVGYIGWQQANPAITGTVLRYTTSDKTVSVTFEVDKPANRTASCTIAAVDVHNSVVGSVDVQVPAGRGKNIMSYALSTTAVPDSVLVQSCSLTT